MQLKVHSHVSNLHISFLCMDARKNADSLSYRTAAQPVRGHTTNSPKTGLLPASSHTCSLLDRPVNNQTNAIHAHARAVPGPLEGQVEVE